LTHSNGRVVQAARTVGIFFACHGGMTGFRDYFSGHAAQYAQARPRYPSELFNWIATLVSGHRLAWDCGTGNGQAACELARHYTRVVATDASREQIDNAIAHPNVEYRVARAEHSDLPSESVDAITVAQALHWFPLNEFYAEVRRVLRPRGVLVAWCYGLHTVAPDSDALTQEFYRDVVGPYWPAERNDVEQGYRTLAFPFVETVAPVFEMREFWTLEQFLSYLRSWSATRRFVAARGSDPVDELAIRLKQVWETGRRWVRWPLHLRVGIN
jgi:SAM-dependent methyltransferase